MSFVDLELGADAQNQFARLLLRPIVASKQEDMYHHWDVGGVFSDLSGDVLKFDVKDNLDKKHQAFPVELQNVHGQNGWLYGRADCIAFHHPTSFTVVWRFLLVELVERLMEQHGVTLDSYVTEKDKWLPLGESNPDTQVYRREKWGRDDRVVMVPKNDMWAISASRPLKRENQATLEERIEKLLARMRSKALRGGGEG